MVYGESDSHAFLLQCLLQCCLEVADTKVVLDHAYTAAAGRRETRSPVYQDGRFGKALLCNGVADGIDSCLL